MDYFTRSQEVKDQILATPTILDKLKLDFQPGDIINSASSTLIYRVGQLPSGLHIAARWIGLTTKDAETRNHFLKRRFESYALNAESLHAQGKDVVSFCVGLSVGGEVSLLVEDLTSNGRCKVTEISDLLCTVVCPDGKRRTVHVDIDDRWEDSAEGKSLKYFANEAMIIL